MHGLATRTLRDTSPDVAVRRFHAMGSEADVLVVAARARALAAVAQRRIRTLEARWSRFRPTSELSGLNASAGSWRFVSADTVELVEQSIEAWHRTDGAFDPSLLGALERAGYDRPFDRLPRVATLSDGAPKTRTSLWGIEVNRLHSAVRFPAGLALDPGGIGKGLAGDIVTRELIALGATGALVNLGGDIVVAGAPPPEYADEGRWAIAIDDPFQPGRELARVAVDRGGIATSSTLKRRWSVRREHDDDGPIEAAHHLLDPRTHASADSEVVSATVCAGSGWWAEAQTKQLIVNGLDAARGALGRATTILVTARREMFVSPGLEGALL